MRIKTKTMVDRHSLIWLVDCRANGSGSCPRWQPLASGPSSPHPGTSTTSGEAIHAIKKILLHLSDENFWSYCLFNFLHGGDQWRRYLRIPVAILLTAKSRDCSDVTCFLLFQLWERLDQVLPDRTSGLLRGWEAEEAGAGWGGLHVGRVCQQCQPHTQVQVLFKEERG